MKKVFVISMLLIVTGCGYFDKWTREDKILQCTQLIVQGLDWQQTKEIARNDDFYETNPMIGEYPTQWEVDRYFLISASTGMLVSHVLPQEYRKYWQMFWIGSSSSSVFHNYNVGIRIKL